MLNFSLLDAKTIFCEPDKELNIFNENGKYTELTDFALITGCNCEEAFAYDNVFYGSWWTQSYDHYGCLATSVNARGVRKEIQVNPYVPKQRLGVRPAVNYFDLKKKVTSEEILSNYLTEAEYGEYPQDIVLPEINIELENLYLNTDLIKPTSKVYTLDCYNNDNFKSNYYKEFEEYEYVGQKYIRVEPEFIKNFDKLKLPKDKAVWIKVCPIKWWVDREYNVAISQKVLFPVDNFYLGSLEDCHTFRDSNVYHMLNNYFAEEIIPGKIKKRSELSNEFLNSSQYKDIKSSVKVILSNYNLSSEMLEKAANDIINEILSSICNSCDDTYEDDVIINKGQVKIKNRKS